MALKNTSFQLLSEIATNGNHGENSSYFDGWKAYESDPYHPTENPQGVIQMGLAENPVRAYNTAVAIYRFSYTTWFVCSLQFLITFAAVLGFDSRVDSEESQRLHLHPRRSEVVQIYCKLSGLPWIARVQKCRKISLCLITYLPS